MLPIYDLAKFMLISRSGVWYAMGGILMLIACILEFVIGNTFTGVAFGTYGMYDSLVLLYQSLTRVGGFWIAQAITLTPYFAAASSYEPGNPANPGFHASFGMSSA